MRFSQTDMNVVIVLQKVNGWSKGPQCVAVVSITSTNTLFSPNKEQKPISSTYVRVRRDFTCFEILNHRLNNRIQKVVELEGKKRQVYV